MKLLAWLALAGVLLLPACSTSKPTLPTQPAATTPASTAVSRATAAIRTSTPVVEPTVEAAYPAPAEEVPTGEPAPNSAYPAPAGQAPPLTEPSTTSSPAAYPAPSTEQALPSPESPSSQSNSPYPAPGGSQSGPPPVPTSPPGTSPATAFPTGSDALTPTLASQNPTATEPSNPQASSPYPGPAQGTQPGPTTTASPVPTSTAVPVQSTPTGGPGNAELTPTGTLLPTSRPVVRVALKATDPSTVRLDAGQLQLVEFFAFWSPLCKSMAPVVHLLEDEYSGYIQFTYLDVDNRANDRFKQALGYQFVPHFFLLDSQGEILKQWKGYVRAEDLEAEFAAQGVSR